MTIARKDILTLIKQHVAIRQYQDRPVPREILDKILDAGIWGPSVHGIQPWRFSVVTSANIIKRLSQVMKQKSQKMHAGYNMVLRFSAETISNAPVLILIYNNQDLQKFMKRMGGAYLRCARISEMQALAGSIQNMVLAADFLGVGSCWLTLPVFCRKEINKMLKDRGELAGVLTLGYATAGRAGTRSKRRAVKSMVKFVEE